MNGGALWSMFSILTVRNNEMKQGDEKHENGGVSEEHGLHKEGGG